MSSDISGVASPDKRDAEEETSEAEALQNTQALDLCLKSSDPDVVRLVAEIFETLPWPNNNFHAEGARQHLQLVLLNLYQAWRNDPKRYVRYSRRAGRYKRWRYNPQNVGYTHLIRVVDILHAAGLIEHRGGIPGKRHFWRGKQSRMRGSATLHQRFPMLLGCLIERIEDEVLILRSKKDARGNPTMLNYRETKARRKMRAQVHIINASIAGARIDLYASDDQMHQISIELQEKNKRDGNINSDEKVREPINFGRTILRRVFNNARWDHGGRFYHGWWQEIPKKYRSLVLINDRQTIELDYSGIHYVIFYADAGLPLPDDPYTLTGVEPKHRELIKNALNVLINAEDAKGAKGKVKQLLAEYGVPAAYPSAAQLIAALMERHAPISQYFASGEGVKAQFRDSQIAEQVLLNLRQQGIVTLPVHDSFIAAEGRQGELLDAMQEALNKIVPKASRAKIKAKVPTWFEPQTLQRPELTIGSLDRPHREQYAGYYTREREWQRRRLKAQRLAAANK